MPAAARVDDPITHSEAHSEGITQMLEGAAVGALLGVALIGLTVLTGGADLLVIGAVVAAGGTILSMGGRGFLQGVKQGQQKVEKHGQVKTGSGNVTINRRAAAAACLSMIECDEHSGPQKQAQGSRTVTINGRMAARVGDKSVCDAVIGAGSPDVTVGGATGQCAAIHKEVADWETGLAKGAIVVGTIAQFVGLILSGAGIVGAIRAASGVARAVLLARTGVGLLGSFGVGGAGTHYGGKWFGEGSWQQEGMGLAGAIFGGGVFGKMAEGGIKMPTGEVPPAEVPPAEAPPAEAPPAEAPPDPPFTKLSQPGGLKATEGTQITKPNGSLGPASHPLDSHGPDRPLGVSDGPNSVEQRMIDRPNMLDSSKFTDRATMETAIGKAIDANKAEIDAWLKTNPPAGRNMDAIEYDPQMGNLGAGYSRPSPGTPYGPSPPLNNVTVVLKSDGAGGYIIQTAFPGK